MMWVLVAAFMFNGQPSVLSDQKIYFELDKVSRCGSKT